MVNRGSEVGAVSSRGKEKGKVVTEEMQTPEVAHRLKQLKEARDKAEKALQTFKEKLIPITFNEGDQVWLEGRNLKTHHPTAKLAP